MGRADWAHRHTGQSTSTIRDPRARLPIGGGGMNGYRNIITNPRPSATTPNPWLANGVSMQVENDSILLVSDSNGGNCYAKTILRLPAGSYVFSALTNSFSSIFDPFSNRALLVVEVDGQSEVVVGTALYKTCPARYACGFTVAEERDIELRMYAPSTAAAGARWADAMVCTADDWQALRAMTPPVNYFDGGRITTTGTLVSDEDRSTHA